MAITQIWTSEATAGTEEDLTVLDYDSTAQAVGITCTNGTPGVPANGHGTLSLWDNTVTPATLIESVNTDQFNDGSRHVLVGPGATGVDVNNNPLSTHKISANKVARIIPVKGQTLTAFVELTWMS